MLFLLYSMATSLYFELKGKKNKLSAFGCSSLVQGPVTRNRTEQERIWERVC